MRAIWNKIDEEYKKGVALREIALGEDNKAHEIRKEQQKHWQKYNFFKKLNSAIESENREVNKMIGLDKDILNGINKECGLHYEKVRGKILIEDVPDIIQELLFRIEQKDLEIQRLNSPEEDDNADEYYENMKMGD